jgi:hypothetical protein
MRRDPNDTGEDRVVLSEEDEAALHEQLVERHEAQRARDYDTADRIRECIVHNTRYKHKCPDLTVFHVRCRRRGAVSKIWCGTEPQGTDVPHCAATRTASTC